MATVGVKGLIGAPSMRVDFCVSDVKLISVRCTFCPFQTP